MKNKNLHPLQGKLLNLLAKNTDDPLTIREMKETLGVSSTSVIAHHLFQLEKKGYLKKNPYNPRDYQILKGFPEKQIAYLNLYGLAHCGPSGSVLDGDPIERIPVPTRFLTFPSTNGFMVKAKGDSMMPKINDGDLIIAEKTKSVGNGKLAVCVNNGEALIKTIQKEKADGTEKVILISLNPAYVPFLASEDFKIEGEVRGVITKRV